MLIEPAADSGAKASLNTVHIRLWERALTWLVLLSCLVHIGSLVFLIASNWRLALDEFRNGTIPVVSLALQFLLLSAAVLLVRLNKWCFPLFVAHIVASISYIAYYYGLSAMPWYFSLGYIFELAIVGFSAHLIGRGILK